MIKRSEVFVCLAILALSTLVGAQKLNYEENPLPSRYPLPYVIAGFQLNGGGYSAVSQELGGGLDLELKHFLFIGSATYDNAHKTNDGTLNNRNGHDRMLEGKAFYRFRPWYVGGGASWSQLATTNYTKESWRPKFGVGRDWFRESYSFRGELMYRLPGTDHQNAVQGPEFTLWFPSPATKHHVFFQQVVDIYTFHATITDPTNRLLTADQVSRRGVSTFVDWRLIYRF